MIQSREEKAKKMFIKYLGCSVTQAVRFYQLCLDRSNKNRTPLNYEVECIISTYAS